MPTILIRDVPVKLHKQLLALAKAEGRSLNKQVLILLREAMNVTVVLRRDRRKKIITQISSREPIKIHTAPVDLIRQFRDNV